MADISNMSDADLDAAIKAQTPDVSKMSDSDLDAAIAAQSKPTNNIATSMQPGQPGLNVFSPESRSQMPSPGGDQNWSDRGLQSISGGLAQGLTFGHADELEGAGKAALVQAAKMASLLPDPDTDRALKVVGLPGSVSNSFADNYVAARDDARARYEAEKAANPWTYDISKMGGQAVTTAMTPAGKLLTGKALPTIATSVGLGALAGEGESTASLTQNPSQVAKDAATNAALAAGTATAMRLGYNVVKGVGNLAMSGASKVNPLTSRQEAQEVVNKAQEAFARKGISAEDQSMFAKGPELEAAEAQLAQSKWDRAVEVIKHYYGLGTEGAETLLKQVPSAINRVVSTELTSPWNQPNEKKK